MRRFAGGVLIGGASTRMGADKATLEISGVPLGQLVADALIAAGADPVAWIGGTDRHRRELAGLHVADAEIADAEMADTAELGPCGGLLAALAWSPRPVVVIAGCDLVGLEPDLVAGVVGATATDGVAMARRSGVAQPHLSAWSTAVAPAVADAIRAGERSLWRLAPPDTAWVDIDGRWSLDDVDTPEDLLQWREQQGLANGNG